MNVSHACIIHLFFTTPTLQRAVPLKENNLFTHLYHHCVKLMRQAVGLASNHLLHLPYINTVLWTVNAIFHQDLVTEGQAIADKVFAFRNRQNHSIGEPWAMVIHRWEHPRFGIGERCGVRNEVNEASFLNLEGKKQFRKVRFAYLYLARTNVVVLHYPTRISYGEIWGNWGVTLMPVQWSRPKGLYS